VGCEGGDEAAAVGGCDAVEEGLEPQDDFVEHSHRDQGGSSAAAGCGDCA